MISQDPIKPRPACRKGLSGQMFYAAMDNLARAPMAERMLKNFNRILKRTPTCHFVERRM